MSKATEQRIKQKLKDIEKTTNIPFNRLLDTLFLERILVRIGQSKYRENLIFKGGMCLAHFLKLGRSTKDIDFVLKKLDGNENIIQSVITDIANQDIGDDFTFSDIKVKLLSLTHKKYPGYRVTMTGQVGQIKNKVSLDVGIGDVVRPREIEVELLKANQPLFEQSVALRAYPPEYIFSEKLEAIIYLGEINGRMKDFFDCYRMIDAQLLDSRLLKMAVNETFSERQTIIETIPNELKKAHQSKWAKFIRKENIDNLEIAQVIDTTNEYLIKSGIIPSK